MSYVFAIKSRNRRPRFKIGHNKPLKNMLTPELLVELERRQEWIGKDKIQAKILAKSGHLLGSTPGCANKDDSEEAIMNQPAMKGIEIEVRVEYCRLTNRGGWIKKKKKNQREPHTFTVHGAKLGKSKFH